MPRKLRLKGHDTLHLGPDGASAGIHVTPTGELSLSYYTMGVSLVKADVDVPTGIAFQFPVVPQVAGHNLVDLRLRHSTEGSGTGNTLVQLRRRREEVGGLVEVDMLTTPLEIDSGERDSINATTQPVIDLANDDLALMDELQFIVQGIPATTAPQGLFGYLVTRRPAV